VAVDLRATAERSSVSKSRRPEVGGHLGARDSERTRSLVGKNKKPVPLSGTGLKTDE
jgi:hypothetical protein